MSTFDSKCLVRSNSPRNDAKCNGAKPWRLVALTCKDCSDRILSIILKNTRNNLKNAIWYKTSSSLTGILNVNTLNVWRLVPLH